MGPDKLHLAATEAGLRRVAAVRCFLMIGTHLLRDLPKLTAGATARHPEYETEAGQSVEGYPFMATVMLGCVQEVLEGSKAPQ